jgi:hypothetical protein
MIANLRGIAQATVVAVALCLSMPMIAHAESGAFAAGHLAFQIPAQWSSEGRRTRFNLVSPGEDAFIVLTVLQPGDENVQRAQAGQLLNQYLADVALADGGEKTTLGGMPALRFTGTGSSDATSVTFVAAVVVPRGNAPVLVLAYTTQSSFAATAPAFEAFLASLHPQ